MRDVLVKNLHKSFLELQLTNISIRELLFINSTPIDIYSLRGDLFYIAIGKNSSIDKKSLMKLIKGKKINIFVKRKDYSVLKETIRNTLTQTTRSLSVGDPSEKIKRQVNLMTIHMGHLYQNPENDLILKTHHQHAKNLAYFLLNNINLHDSLFKDLLKQKHHYILAQPLLSSIFVLGVLKYSQLYDNQEIENMFVTSYFKDIGMSVVPIDKYSKNNLNNQDKKIIENHPAFSIQILKDRIPLRPFHFKIIENHHTFSLLNDKKTLNIEVSNIQTKTLISGLETIVISIMDIIAAMTTPRPYRDALTLKDSLELVKNLMSDQYPQEFRLIVNYFKKYFSKN